MSVHSFLWKAPLLDANMRRILYGAIRDRFYGPLSSRLFYLLALAGALAVLVAVAYHYPLPEAEPKFSALAEPNPLGSPPARGQSLLSSLGHRA